MAAPYSNDLRWRVVDGVNGGMSRREAAEHFGVSVSSAIRWTALEARTGDVSPAKMGGHCPQKLARHRSRVLGLVEEHADETLDELRCRLTAEGVEIGYGGLWRFLERENITRKKSLARQRTGPAGRGRGTRGLAAAPA